MKTKINPRLFPERILLIILVLLLALIVLAQANPGTRLPNRDYGFYVYIGEQIVHGKLPYRDVWESKPPAIFYLNAAALWIGRGSRWGVWIVEYVFLVGAICLSFYLMKKLWGMWAALFGILIWLSGLDLTLEGGNFTEEFPLLFHFAALIIFLKLIEQPQYRIYNFILGLLFSICLLFRPNNALMEAMIILALMLIRIFRHDIRGLLTHTLWITIGVIPPLLITTAYFWVHGLLMDMLEASIFYNLAYSGAQLTTSSPLVTGFGYLKGSAWIALTGYVATFFLLKRSFKSPSFYLLVFLLAGWPITIYLSDPARRNYGHYYMNWLPFIALLSGLVFRTLQNKFSTDAKITRAPSWLSFAVVFIFAMAYFATSGRAGQYQKAMDRILNGPEKELRSRVSVYVENHTRPGEYVLFWATLPGENFMSNREAPYSTLFYPMLIKSNISDRLNDDFLQDVTANPPVLVVDMGHLDPLSLDPQKRSEQRAVGIGWPFPPDNLEEVFQFIENNYSLDAEIMGKSIYRLHGTKPP